MRKIRTVRRDISGKDPVPGIPEPDLVVFHWSPSKNRKSINKLGLVPGRLDDTSQDAIWRAPYVVLSEDPILAWSLCAHRRPDIYSWDLWSCNVTWQTSFKGWELITDTYIHSGEPYIKEYRVYTRIYKRDLKYVATREV